MTAPYDAPLDSDFLFVKLKVQTAGEARFRNGMNLVLDRIFREKLGWKLVRAGKRRYPKSTDPEHLDFYHLWQADTPINLWNAQVTVAGDTDYAALYEAVDREEQDVFRIPAVYAPTRAFNLDARPWMLIQELKLAKDWADVLAWQWTLPVPVGANTAAPEKFQLAFAFQAATSVLRSHWHFFESDADFELAAEAGAGSQQGDENALTVETDAFLSRLSSPRDPAVDKFDNERQTDRARNRVALKHVAKAVEREPPELYENISYDHPFSM
ncbi:MAG: hypothetical protein RL701_5628 [Pseudomonadota bacterium]|jgi:hypothetical protein